MKIKNKKSLIINVIVLLMILCSVIFVISCNMRKVKVLVIQDNTSHIKLEFYIPDNSFSLGYMHSVMKTPAEEFFYADEKNNIVLEKTEYESYGVGLPFLSSEGEFEIVGDKFVLKMHRTFKKLDMIISPIPNHWLHIGNDKYELNKLLKKPNSSITIYVEEKYRLINMFSNTSNSKVIVVDN